MLSRMAAIAALWILAVEAAAAQTPSPPTPPVTPETAPTPAGDAVIPAGTVVYLEIDDPLSAGRSFEGQTFRLHLAEPIVVGGQILVPAGTHGGGEVIEAKRPGMGGKPGALIVAARYLVLGETCIPLGHFRYGRAGRDNVDQSLVVGIAVGLPGLFITGGDVKIAPGLQASAKVSSDVSLKYPPTPPSDANPANQGQPAQGVVQ